MGAEVDPSDVWRFPALADLRRYSPVFRDGCEARWTFSPAATDQDGDVESVPAAELAYPVLALVPGVGFGPDGIRLGRGAGFYDRALADLRACGTVYAVGLAFECQVVPSLPSDAWDQRVDSVLTERRVIVCSGLGERGEAVP